MEHLINGSHLVAVCFAPGNPFGIEFGTYTSLVKVDAQAELVFFREYRRERPVQVSTLVDTAGAFSRAGSVGATGAGAGAVV